MAKVKVPKRVAGVKVPKELRKQAKRALDLVDSPAARDLALAGLAIAAERVIDRGRAKQGNGKRLQDVFKDGLDGLELGEVLRAAAVEGARRFLEGFEEGQRAGKASADYLAQLMQGKTVTCEIKTAPDNKKVHYGLCKADGQDLSAAMVSAGMAWSLPELTSDYTVQDSNAQYMLRGINAHTCNKAWDWRNEQLMKTG